jgi:nucleoside-diphosphate-sugar epimerase
LNVLITGAAGFLGRHVVTAVLKRGHRVRAVIRPSTSIDHLGWIDGVEIFRADLRAPSPLTPAFDDVDVLLHIAAGVGGSEAAQMADTVVGTERLLEAMARSATRRLVLASSLSVYGWASIRGTLTEESPLEDDLYRRDAYAIVKTWQERVVRRMSHEHNWELTVLRPGFIWGRDREYHAGIGQQLGRWHLIFGPSSRPPLTHVENCADCFAEAIENPRAVGQTFNVVDGHDVSSWRYMGEYLRRTGTGCYRIPVPYRLALTGANLAEWINRRFCRSQARVPGLLIPCRFQARFKPLRFSTRKLEEVLGWRPPLDFARCLQRTYMPRALLDDTSAPPETVQELHHV